MKAQVFTLPEFHVIGMMGQGPTKFSSWWIRPLWKRFDEEFDSIRHLVKRDSFGEISGIWGLMSDPTRFLLPWDDEGRYLAGCEAAAGISPPGGFTIWNVPSRTYLVAPCVSDDYQNVYDEVMKVLLRGDRYVLTGAVMERYPSGAQAGTMHLFFPVHRVSMGMEGG